MKRSKKYVVLVSLLSVSLVLLVSGAFSCVPAPTPTPTPKPPVPKEIKIGVILPLSGPLAPTGKSLMEGADLAADIINSKYPEIDISVAKWEGIPNLGGVKIKLIRADSRGEPSWGADQAKRLIRDERVTGLMGCYQSSVTKTASLEAERAAIPLVNPDSSSPALTKRGLEWFWRVSPHDTRFTKDLFDFLDGLVEGKAPGVGPVPKEKLDTLAIANEDTEFGMAGGEEIEKFAAERGYKIVEHITYPHDAAELTSESRRLIASEADCFLFIPYVADAILYMKTLKELGAKPRLIWGQDAGFIIPDFYKTLGADVNAILTRDLFSPELGKVKPTAGQLNKMYKEITGHDFSGSSARDFVGVQVWAHALNSAASTEPEALRKALNELYIPGEELIMPWKGVRFGSPFPGDIHQNELGSGVINQYQGWPDGTLEVIFPFDFATADLIYPFPGWK